MHTNHTHSNANEKETKRGSGRRRGRRNEQHEANLARKDREIRKVYMKRKV
jgi:hypothetical protein